MVAHRHRRKVTPELAERRSRADEELGAVPGLPELEERVRQADMRLAKKKKKVEPLVKFIVTSFKEEMKRDTSNRERFPHLPWGTSLRRQLVVAQDEEEYKTLLKGLRGIYQHETPDIDLKVIAFVRRDRLRTERRAAMQGRETVSATSPAGDEMDWRNNVIYTRSMKKARDGA